VALTAYVGRDDRDRPQLFLSRRVVPMAESIHTSRPLVWHRIGGRRRWRDVHGRTALPACGGWLTGPPPPCAIIANSLVLSGRYCQVLK